MGAALRQSGSGQRRGRSDDGAFRQAVDQLKERVHYSDAAGALIKLKKVGQEYIAPCPFHSDRTPSFTINNAKGFGHCFGCCWHGDVIKFVMDVLGCGFREAYQRLADADLPQIPPQQRERERAEDRLADLAKVQDARQFWKAGAAPARTPADAYLRARGITLPLPPTIRFGLVPTWRDPETGKWNRARPCMMCACEDMAGEIVGIQRVYFKDDNPALGKADKKLSLGSVNGAAFKLGPAEETVIIVEGPEDGLSILQEGPGFPVWVPLGTSMMPGVQFPPIVKRVVIAGQNDTAGRVAVNKSAIAYSERGLRVEFAWPSPEYRDWNDQLRGAGQ